MANVNPETKRHEEEVEKFLTNLGFTMNCSGKRILGENKNEIGEIDSKKILSTDLEPSLSIDEKNVLINIHNSMTDLINYFPFSDVIRQVSNLTIYARNSPEINQLRRKVNERIREGRIKNVEYVHLLSWIHKYLDLGMDGGIKDQNTFVMENLTSINTLYELLIFFEFFVYRIIKIRM